MSLSRREVLAAAAVAGVGAMSGGGKALAAESYVPVKPPREAKLRMCCQEGGIPGSSFAEKLDRMEKWDFDGFEVGGGTLLNPKKFDELKEALKGRPIKMGAICAGFHGTLISEKPEVREQAMTSMKEILTKAGEIGSTGLIIVPAFNGQTTMPHQQARELLTGFARWDKKDRKREGALLQELGDHAAKAGTRILLEPLNRDECYFLRTLADGASICRDLENPGIAMMGDFWHMTWEETNDMGAFLSAGEHLHHVHMASRRTRSMPGDDGDADNYVVGFKGLKMIGYQDFVSFECGCKGDRMTRVPEAVQMLRKQWAQA